jgi:hypothetical protein
VVQLTCASKLPRTSLSDFYRLPAPHFESFDFQRASGGPPSTVFHLLLCTNQSEDWLDIQATCSHRPSRRTAWRAMPRFGPDSGRPDSNPLAPLHADPVARALGPGANRKPTSLSPVGVAPVPSAPHHRSVAHRLPEGACGPGCLTGPPVAAGLPRHLRTFQQVSVSPDHPKVTVGPV